MKKLSRFLLGVSLAATWCGAAAAQMPQQNASIPKVLQITREFVKPGKAGLAHEKTESAFVQAAARAKWATHYVAMTSLSGRLRALFLTSYDSFEAWEKDNEATAKNTTLMNALDRASVADGELLDKEDQGVFVFHEEMSLRPNPDLVHKRYLEATVFHVRPGRDKEWTEVVKMARDGYEKAVPDAHWGMFELIYGGEGGTYILLTSRTTLAEVDRGFQADKQFAAALGEAEMKKLNELYGDAVSSSEQQLFAFNPHMSYVPEEWKKADEFWNVKTAAPAARPAKEEKKVTP